MSLDQIYWHFLSVSSNLVCFFGFLLYSTFWLKLINLQHFIIQYSNYPIRLWHMYIYFKKAITYFNAPWIAITEKQIATCQAELTWNDYSESYPCNVEYSVALKSDVNIHSLILLNCNRCGKFIPAIGGNTSSLFNIYKIL